MDIKLIARDLSRYLENVLRTPVRLREFKERREIPAYLTELYETYSGNVLGRRCVFVMAGDLLGAAPTLAKHVAAFSKITGELVILAVPHLGRTTRDALIEAGVSFAVPGNQLFIPDLATDLREHFLADRHTRSGSLRPTAQSIVLDSLLAPGDRDWSAISIAARLGTTKMSVTRAFDELEEIGAVEGARRGRERVVKFVATGRDLFDLCLPRFRNPVRVARRIATNVVDLRLPASGESALSMLTDLAPPSCPVYAVDSRHWTSVVDELRLEVDPGGNAVVETWSYDPIKLGGRGCVDPLSLYVRYKDHEDERVAMAAESLLEKFPW